MSYQYNIKFETESFFSMNTFILTYLKNLCVHVFRIHHQKAISKSQKAISKSETNASSDDSDDLILPHVEDISTRAILKKRLTDSINQEDSIGDDELVSKDDIRVESLRILRSNRDDLVKQLSSGEISTFYSPKSCPICLERYTNGDDICWSRNKKCHHAYHLDCILEWLLHSNECPLCRIDYLNQSTESGDEESL